MRAPLPLSFTFLLAASLACAGLAAPSACTTSGTVVPIDGGGLQLLDGALAVLPDGAIVANVSCVFDELDTYSCPGVTLPPPQWVGKCVSEDDCRTRVNGGAPTKSAGCDLTTAYRNVQEIQMSCAAWQATDATVPVVDSGPPPVCAPGSVSSFSPTWHPPRAKTTACNKTQIDSYLQCLDDAATTLNPPSCKEWSGPMSSTDSACLTCLFSNETDAQYGPLVLLPGALLINVAGCLALAEGKVDGSGCGGALQADQECQRAACLPTCPMGNASGVSAEAACETLANVLPGDAGGGGVCASFVTPAQCAATIEGGDAGTNAERLCFGAAGGGSSGQFEAVALAFCGP